MEAHHARKRLRAPCVVNREDSGHPGAEESEEECTCTGRPPLKLVGMSGVGPIRCMDCHQEVRCTRLFLGKELLDATGRWRRISGGIYDLWFADSEYEEWAADQLRDVGSPLNRMGRSIQAEIDKRRRCYYDLFRDEIQGDPGLPPCCPDCGDPLRIYSREEIVQAVCDPCGIVIGWMAADP